MTESCGEELPLSHECWLGCRKVFRHFRSQTEEPSTAFARELEWSLSDNTSFISREPDESLHCRVRHAFRKLRKFQKDLDERGLSFLALREFCAKMSMHISEVELVRLFAAANESDSGHMSCEEFCNAARDVPFFSNLVDVISVASEYVVGKNYDYSQSTKHNYTDHSFSLGRDSGNVFSHVEDASVDASRAILRSARKVWRTSGAEEYQCQRIKWQDLAVLTAMNLSEERPAPWLVMTFAPPAAFPGRVLEWLSRRGFLSLRSVVPVSFERFVHMIPEWPVYLRKQGQAGRRHLVEEASLLEALACEVAMVKMQHVWLDCTLGDTTRVGAFLRDLRSRHPAYRVATLFVTADPVIMEARSREALCETGFDVTIQEEGESQMLCHSDFVARVDNSGAQPSLQSVMSCTAGLNDSWVDVGRRFEGFTVDRAMFPHGLAAVSLESCVMNSNVLKGLPSDRVNGRLQLDVILCGSSTGCFSFAKHVESVLPDDYLLEKLDLATSPAHSTPPGGREVKLVDHSVSTARWAYLYAHPFASGLLSRSSLHRDGVPSTSVLARMLLRGCFVVFNDFDKVVRVDVPSDKPSKHTLQFTPPVGIPGVVEEALGDRWQVVVDEFLRQRGAMRWCWLMPGEELCGYLLPRSGAYAFQLDTEAAARVHHRAVFFGVVV